MISNYFLPIYFVVKNGERYLDRSWKDIYEAMRAGTLCYVITRNNDEALYHISFGLVETAEFSDNVYSLVVSASGTPDGVYFECESESDLPKWIQPEP